MNDPADFHAEGFPHQSYYQIAQRIGRTQKAMRSAEIRLPDNGRFAQYKKMLTSFAQAAEGNVDPGKLDFSVLHQALFEWEMLGTIIEGLGHSPEVPGWRQKVGQVVKGTTLPQDETGVTRPRDTHFELFLGAVYRLGGCAVTLAEPDVVVTSDGWEFGVAAKRPKSIERLAERLTDAGEQISRSGIDGVIALDLSRLLNTGNEALEVGDQSEALRALEHSALFVRKHARKIKIAANAPNAVGVIGVMHCLFYRAAPRALGSATTAQSTNLCPTEDARFESLRQSIIHLADGFRVANGY